MKQNSRSLLISLRKLSTFFVTSLSAQLTLGSLVQAEEKNTTAQSSGRSNPSQPHSRSGSIHYRLQAGDSFSTIASSVEMQKLYPDTDLYGARGRLAILHALNPGMKDADLVKGAVLLLKPGNTALQAFVRKLHPASSAEPTRIAENTKPKKKITEAKAIVISEKTSPVEIQTSMHDTASYQAKRGETLSDIASTPKMRELYPDTKLYGMGGRLQILLMLNPKLRTGVVGIDQNVTLATSETVLQAWNKKEASEKEKFDKTKAVMTLALGKTPNLTDSGSPTTDRSIASANKSTNTAEASSLSPLVLKDDSIKVYYAKKGDTLSTIAATQFTGPKVYGKGGRLEFLVKLNPHITDKNTIFPGDLLLIDPQGERSLQVGSL